MRCCCGKKDIIDEPIIINNMMHEPFGPEGNFCGPVDRHTIRELLADNKRLKRALKKYGVHRNDEGCFCETYKSSMFKCSCGWEDIQSEIEKTTSEDE